MRRGVTLVELLLAMTILAVIGAIAAIALAQQARVASRVAAQAGADVQLRGALAPLLADLAPVSPAAGDLRPGEARDSTLAVRTTMAEGLVCVADSGSGVMDVARLTRGRTHTPAPGDSVWLYQGGAWRVAAIDHAHWVEDGACAAIPDLAGPLLRVALREATRVGAGAPMRFTRRVRYSLYRASDGMTYLGLREWNASQQAFTGLQPVAGPFAPGISRFHYYDSLGAPLASGIDDVGQIAAVGVSLQAPSSTGVAAGIDSPHLRADIVIALRNRR